MIFFFCQSSVTRCCCHYNFLFCSDDWNTAWSPSAAAHPLQHLMNCLFSELFACGHFVCLNYSHHPSLARRCFCPQDWCWLHVLCLFHFYLFFLVKEWKMLEKINRKQDVTYFMLIAYSVHSLLLCRIRYVLFSRSKRATSAWHLSIGPANLNIHKQLL